MDLIAQKSVLQKEDFDGGAAASEGTVKLVGQNVQFINQTAGIQFMWELAGPYSRIASAQISVACGRIVPFNAKIVYVGLSNLTEGVSGSTEFDIIRHPVAGGSSSIFTTKPSIPFGTGDNSWVITNAETNTDIFKSNASITSPVVASTVLTAGDLLTCNFTAKQSLGEEASIIIGIQPT